MLMHKLFLWYHESRIRKTVYHNLLNQLFIIYFIYYTISCHWSFFLCHQKTLENERFSDVFREKGRSSPLEVFLGKGVLKICSKFTGEHPVRIEIPLRHRRYPINLLHIFQTPFPKNIFGGILLERD